MHEEECVDANGIKLLPIATIVNEKLELVKIEVKE